MQNILFLVVIALAYGLFSVLSAYQIPNALSIVFLLLLAISWISFILYRRGSRNVVVAEFSSIFKLLFVIIFIRTFLFEPMQVPSGSMEPTLRVGDFIAVNKYRYGIKDPIFQKTLIPIGEVKAGDIIVFKAPHQPWQDYVKRVVGVGGDIVSYDNLKRTLKVVHNGVEHAYSYDALGFNPDYFYHGSMQFERVEHGAVSHHILNNNQALDFEPYYFTQEGLPRGTWVVPEGHYFVMGDNRDNSEDSRFWGFVPQENVVGQAVLVIVSLDKKANEYPSGLRFDRFFKGLN